MELENYISYTNISVVEVKQMYKDKATLKAVIENYKVKNDFNFKVKRSDNKMYLIQLYDDIPNDIYFVCDMFTMIY